MIGAVNKPLVYQANRATSLLEVLTEAGGIANDAGSAVIVTRGANLAPRTLRVAQLDCHLCPTDLIEDLQKRAAPPDTQASNPVKATS